MLGRIKDHQRVTYLNKTQRCGTGFCFRIHRVRKDQGLIAIKPKLILQQDIACIVDQGMRNPKVYCRCYVRSSGKLFLPAGACGFLLEHIIDGSSSFRSEKSNAFVS
ncbi:hypothetical protein AOQ73_19505 [Bradyrhizobium pachyrhizi]|nr:hypothetical protein AOQ73_19505 [Bradyrhizobium pachyrhizi]ODM72688.1 hypothetical protein A6X20_40060 [Bradyrhizobium elkanii]ODM72921.1 hypothetical protein A6452_41080 [Bradyrhizobium elkanii]